MRKRIIIAFFLFVVLPFAGGGVLLWQKLPAIVEDRAAEILTDIGLEGVHLRLDSIDSKQAILSLSFGPDLAQRISYIQLNYSPRLLLDGKISDIVIKQPMINAHMDANGKLTIPGLPASLSSSGDTKWRRILVQDASLHIQTPYGGIVGNVTAEAQFKSNGRIEAIGDLNFSHAIGKIKAAWQIEKTATDNLIFWLDGQIPTLTVGDMQGANIALKIGADLDKQRELLYDADINIEQLSMGAQELGKANILAFSDGAGHQAMVRLPQQRVALDISAMPSADGAIETVFDLSHPDLGAQAILSLEPELRKANLTNGRLSVSDPPLYLEGLSGGVAYKSDSFSGDLRIAKILSQPLKPFAAIVEYQANLEQIDFSYTAQTLEEETFLAGQGWHRWLDVTGQTQLVTAVLPVVPIPTIAVSGLIRADLKASWADKNLETSAQLIAKDVDGVWQDIHLTGVNADVKLTSLMPPISKAPFTLKAKRVTKQQEQIDDISARLSLLPGKQIKIERAEASWLGGKIGLEPLKTGWEMPKKLVLMIQNMPLQPVLQRFNMKEVSTSGRMNGRIPAYYEKGKWHLGKGVLRNTGQGRISYNPQNPPEFLTRHAQGEMLLGALKNLNYNLLEFLLDGALDENLAVNLQIEGRNPDFFDGRPVALNVNITGALADFIKGSIQSYEEIPALVSEKYLNNNGTKK